MATASTASIFRELASIAGKEHVQYLSSDATAAVAHLPNPARPHPAPKSTAQGWGNPRSGAPARSRVAGHESHIDGVHPQFVVAPGLAEEAAAILRLAFMENLVVVPAGGFTHQRIGRTPERIDIVLDLRRLNAIMQYDPGDLTISLQAGVTIQQAQRAVARQRQLLPLDVANPETATVGGVLATAAHGPMKYSFGGVREFCVGIQFATADGKLARAGGRVVKNVAGYDLMKLMIGSFGTLGVITGANFRLFPAPQQYRTFVMQAESLDSLITCRDRILASPLSPMALEIVSPEAGEYLQLEGRWSLVLRAAGSDAVLKRYRSDLSALSSREFEGVQEWEFWQAVSSFSEVVAGSCHDTLIAQVSVPAAEVGSVLGKLTSECAVPDGGNDGGRTARFRTCIMGRANGSLTVAFVPLVGRSGAPVEYAQALAKLRAALPHDGSAVVTLCPTEVKPHIDVWGPTLTDVPTMRVIKQAMDPHDILNRGRFLF